MTIRKRPAIWLIICAFTYLAREAMVMGFDVQAGVAIGAMAVLATKLVESEEAGNAKD